MAVPFGFSAGDFIAAIEVLHKVGKALKRSNGASAQCQQACLDVEFIAQVLRRCHAYTRKPSVDAAIAQQIQLCCQLCHIPLSGFLQSMEKYRHHLRLDGGRDSFALFRMKRTWKQVDWAVAAQDDVAKLKASIAPQLAALGLLFQQVTLEKLTNQGTTIDETLTVAHDTLRQVGAMQPYIQTNGAVYDNTNILLQDLAALRVRTSNTATQGQIVHLASTLHDVARQRDVLTVAQQLATIEVQMVSMHVNQDEGVMATRDLAHSLDTRLHGIEATILNMDQTPKDDGVQRRGSMQTAHLHSWV